MGEWEWGRVGVWESGSESEKEKEIRGEGALVKTRKQVAHPPPYLLSPHTHTTAFLW